MMVVSKMEDGGHEARKVGGLWKLEKTKTGIP